MINLSETLLIPQTRAHQRITSIIRGITGNLVPGQKNFSSAPVLRAGLFNAAIGCACHGPSPWDRCRRNPRILHPDPRHTLCIPGAPGQKNRTSIAGMPWCAPSLAVYLSRRNIGPACPPYIRTTPPIPKVTINPILKLFLMASSFLSAGLKPPLM